MIQNIFKKLPLFVRGSFFIFIITILLQCSSQGIRINNAVYSGTSNIILSSEKNLYQLDYNQNKLVDWFRGLPEDIAIKELSVLSDGALMTITEKNGIYIFTVIKGEIKYIHMPVGEGKLPDFKIRNAYLYQYDKSKKLYVTYYTPYGIGVTECIVKNNWNDITYKTYNKINSALKCNYVHEVTSDLKGNIWFRYSDVEDKGVSVLCPDGTWKHFDKSNSELGDSNISLINVEKTGQGLKGDNIWFVSPAGLSRLDYTKNFVWKLYGEKATFTNTIIRHMGLQSYFTDAIVDIVDLSMLNDSVLIANKTAVYLLGEDNVNRFIPEAVGGIDENEISKISVKENKFLRVLIISPKQDVVEVRAVVMFDLTERKWQRLQYWNFAKAYPEKIFFLPLKSDSDLIIFSYKSASTRYATYNYISGELKGFQPVSGN